MKSLLLKISIFLISIPFSLTGQTTTFQASSREGCDSLSVKFSYSTTLPVNSIKWNFGDNTESSENSPVHKYTNPGKYMVSLVVNEEDSVGLENFILIGKTPEADFQYCDTLGLRKHQVVFHSMTSAESPFPYQYNWKLSDGDSAGVSQFSHQFDSTGIYSARLIISDELGCADTVMKSVTVRNTLEVANVFTPNGDGANDLLIIQGNGETTYSIRIFTRSGMKVFETAAKVIVWDGRMLSGEKVRDGIYYYVLLSSEDSLFKQSGFFYVYGSDR
jgi:gliding motility-associated-like protein